MPSYNPNMQADTGTYINANGQPTSGRGNTQSFGGPTQPDRIGGTGIGVAPTLMADGPKPFDVNDPSTWSDAQRQMMYSQMYSATGGYAGGSPSMAYDPVQGTYAPPDQISTSGAGSGGVGSGGAPPVTSVAPPPIAYDPTIGGMDQRQAQITALLGGAAGRQAPQSAAAMLGPAQTAQDSAFRDQQAGLANQLGRWTSGQDSVSRLQLNDALARNVAQQHALAASARPGQGAMAQRLAAQQAGQLGGNLAGQQAQAGIQERMAAGNALQGLLGTARGQDQTLGMFNTGQQNAQALAAANLLQQNNQFNASAGLQQTGLNDAMTQGLLGQQLGGMGLQQGANLSAAQLAAQQRQQQLELENRLQMIAAQGGNNSSVLNGLLGAAKTGLALYGQYKSGSGGSTSTPTADPSYAGYGSAPY